MIKINKTTSLAPKLGCHYFSSFVGLNAVVDSINNAEFHPRSGSFLLPIKSDSYLDVITVLSCNLKRDIPYWIKLYLPLIKGGSPETLAGDILFCFSDSKYKHVNTDWNILTKVLKDSLQVQNNFSGIYSYVQVNYTPMSHDDLLDIHNEGGDSFYSDSEYSYDDSGNVFKLPVSDSKVSSYKK